MSKTYIVKPHQQFQHQGIWYYEGDIFKSDSPGLDMTKIEQIQTIEQIKSAELPAEGE